MRLSRPAVALNVFVLLAAALGTACHDEKSGPSTRPIGAVGTSTAATQNSDQAPVLLHFDQNNHN